jgi:hypothetical protein
MERGYNISRQRYGKTTRISIRSQSKRPTQNVRMTFTAPSPKVLENPRQNPNASSIQHKTHIFHFAERENDFSFS